jgi:hypothetical protein
VSATPEYIADVNGMTRDPDDARYGLLSGDESGPKMQGVYYGKLRRLAGKIS